MESSQNVSTDSQLPRGLITRRGTQRLPSLRSDSHSSQSFLAPNVSNNSMANTTKGGVLKRTFKPTIPVRRNVNGEESNDNSKRNRTKDNSSYDRKGKQPKSRVKFNDSKQFIQTEGAVFKGESSPHLRSSRVKEESETIGRKRSSNVDEIRYKTENNTEKCEKSKLENKAKTIRKLYGDNFIDDEEDRHSDTHTVYPKGWHTVSNHRHSSSSSSNTVPLNPFNLLKRETQEKMLLMQIPELILNRSDGYIGKMRVYKSGRIELSDNESNIKFDILFDRNTNFEQNVKQENESKYSKPITNNCFDDITEDLVSFSGNDLCTLSTLEHKQVLLAVPSIPLDDKITTNLFL